MGYVKELSNSFFFEIPESQVKEEKGTRDEAMKGARSKGKNKRVSRRDGRE